jgi:hypothetical protein
MKVWFSLHLRCHWQAWGELPTHWPEYERLEGQPQRSLRDASGPQPLHLQGLLRLSTLAGCLSVLLAAFQLDAVADVSTWVIISPVCVMLVVWIAVLLRLVVVTEVWMEWNFASANHTLRGCGPISEVCASISTLDVMF